MPGNVYKKQSPDMLSLIGSAALYNAIVQLRDHPDKQVVLIDL